MLFDKVQTLDLTGQNEHTFSTEYSLWARDENAVETEDAENTGVLEVVIPAAMIFADGGIIRDFGEPQFEIEINCVVE